jgi:hypothetical protein
MFLESYFIQTLIFIGLTNLRYLKKDLRISSKLSILYPNDDNKSTYICFSMSSSN